MENHALYIFDHANLTEDQFLAFYNIVTSCCFLTRRTQLRDEAKRTQKAKKARDRMIAGFAVLENLFGETEKAQMCHVALNHAFNMVSEYGVTPSCYASEGVIGSLKQGVGSRKHPEVNMIKNYMRLNSSKTINLYDREEGPDDPDDSTPVIPSTKRSPGIVYKVPTASDVTHLSEEDMEAACKVLKIKPERVLSVHKLKGKINIGGYERRSCSEEQTSQRAKRPLSEFQLRDPSGKQGSMPYGFGIIHYFLSFTIQSQSQSLKHLVVRADLFKVKKLTARSHIPICDLNDPMKHFIPTAAIGRMIAFNDHPDCDTRRQKCVVYSSPEYELLNWE
jgi:hypothetical protein